MDGGVEEERRRKYGPPQLWRKESGVASNGRSWNNQQDIWKRMRPGRRDDDRLHRERNIQCSKGRDRDLGKETKVIT